MTGQQARYPKRWSLRARLLLSVVALFAAASLVVGVVSVVALRGFLMDRLDEQLLSATGRSQNAVGGDPGDAPVPSTPGTLSEFRAGVQGPFTVTAVVTNAGVLAVVVTSDGDLEQLSDAQSRQLAEINDDGSPVTVSLGGDLGNYRVSATPVSLNGRDTVARVVTGLPLGEVEATLVQLSVVIGAVTLIAVGLTTGAGALIVRRALRPLERVAATASLVTELPLDRGEVALSVRVADADADPSTEVGQVGAAINRMLGHVASALSVRQESEYKVRQFVADASHELRTPLASIRGYAELTRLSNHDLPDDVAHAIGRVESEAKRMTSLVEELLLLARLDEGRDLQRQPFDITRMLIDVVSDAHAAAPEHQWSLDQPEEPVMVDGDVSRLHQAVANLLMNARAHTPDGTSVEVALHVVEEAVSITVTDDGPGIDDDLQPQLFERFARGDSSRSRVAGSTGLGLAIVRAVVTGHGGTVGVSSRPGRTEFRLELPR
ncbi:MAG TPA: HAMP domain-containing sensor histidine kinase [Homoserinimonas sp.]|nr:HAMP domain-containing sensor histidine kinase [Homoserinimonas sp.]